MKTYALEMTAHTGAGIVTLYFSTDPAPAGAAFQPRIVQPGNYSIEAFQGGAAYGKSQVGAGEVRLRNDDGALDYLLDYGLDGRTAVLRMCEGAELAAASYPADWKTVNTGSFDQPEATWPGYNDGEIVLRWRDRMAELHVKLPLAVYSGDNALPSGVEGTADDLKGKTKPLLLGKCFNMALQCVNTSRLIYAVSPPTGGMLDLVTDWDGIAAFDAVTDFFGTVMAGAVVTPLGTEYRRGGCSSTGITVYDAGIPLLQGADYADEADLQANAPAAGYFRVLPSHGYIRLGSLPAGQVTCTAQDNNGNDPHTVGSIMRAVLRDYLLWNASRYNIAELAALDTACPIPAGHLITQDMYVDDLFDALSSSPGACYYFDAFGTFRIFQITDPATRLADITLDSTQIKSITLRSSMGLPNFQVRLRQQKNWSVQTGGLSGGATANWRAWVAQEYRENLATSSTTATKHPLSLELVGDTCFAADAQSEADRRLALYSIRRDLFDVELFRVDTFNTEPLLDWDGATDFDDILSLDQLDFTAFRIGQIIAVGLGGRYGYGTKHMLLVGITVDLGLQKITLTIWG